MQKFKKRVPGSFEPLVKGAPRRVIPFGIRMFAFDFDGVIASYAGSATYEKHKRNPKPNMEVVRAIRTLSKKGHTIIIHSSRGDKFLRAYCKKKKIPFDFINENRLIKTDNPKKPSASVYIDDRGYGYRGQKTSQLVKDLERFQPYWKK